MSVQKFLKISEKLARNKYKLTETASDMDRLEMYLYNDSSFRKRAEELVHSNAPKTRWIAFFELLKKVYEQRFGKKIKTDRSFVTDFIERLKYSIQMENRVQLPKSIKKEAVADFIMAASKAKEAGQKTFKFGGKEYPVTIKEPINEEAPPDPDIEKWINDNKERFRKEYGEERGLEILYGKAWNMYKKKKN